MIWNVAVQKTWPEPHKMDENKIPHEIEDRNKKDTNPDAKKMLPIPATEEEAHKLDLEKTSKGARAVNHPAGCVNVPVLITHLREKKHGSGNRCV